MDNGNCLREVHSGLNARIAGPESNGAEQRKGAGDIEPDDPAAATECGFEDRDAHLRVADWFDLERHPDITFRSTRLCDAYSSRWLAFGKLTMRGVTMPIEVEAS